MSLDSRLAVPVVLWLGVVGRPAAQEPHPHPAISRPRGCATGNTWRWCSRATARAPSSRSPGVRCRAA